MFAFPCSFPLRTPDIMQGLPEPGSPCMVQPAPSLTPFLLSLTRKLASLMVHFLTLLQLRDALVPNEIQWKSLGWAFLPKSNRTDSPWDASCPAIPPSSFPRDRDPVPKDSQVATLRPPPKGSREGKELRLLDSTEPVPPTTKCLFTC